MSRRKAKARKGPEGHAYRENMKTEAGRLLNCENNKKKREEYEADRERMKIKRREEAAEGDDRSAQQPSKKAKRNKSSTKPDEIARSPASIPVASAEIDIANNVPVTDSIDTSPQSGDLAAIHEITTMSIVSSSHIQQKVTRVLELLATFPHDPPAKPSVVMLHSKAAVASKMISIAEIAKRELAQKGGKWFQYNQVEPVMEEKRPTRKGVIGKGEKGESVEKGEPADTREANDSESEEETEAFETMKTPFERAIEGRPKIRAIPSMTLYLSRVRIDSLRNLYG